MNSLDLKTFTTGFYKLVASFEFSFDKTNKFDTIYPVRDDLADISPHHYEYDIKYIKNLINLTYL
jgi:hypothetical protein